MMLFILRFERAISSIMQLKLTKDALDRTFALLSGLLDLRRAEPVHLVICGGSALIATDLRERTTNDADVLALMNPAGQLISPAPLPPLLLATAAQVARDLGLPPDWLNNGPSADDGGLFQMGLPAGLEERLSGRTFGPRLTVSFIGRLDQIHFKLYAAADQRDATHLADLAALTPTDGELELAARWAMTHDVSEGFRWILRELLEELGHGNAARNL